MKVMVVGGGGREHAIVSKIKLNKSVEKIYVQSGAKEGSVLRLIAMAKERKIPLITAHRLEQFRWGLQLPA